MQTELFIILELRLFVNANQRIEKDYHSEIQRF